MLIQVLLTIYVALISLDLLFMLMLHFFHDRKGYYKTAAGVWAGLLLDFFMEGLTAQNFSNLNHLFGISFSIIVSCLLAKLAADIYKFSFPFKKFLLFFFAMWTLGAILHFGFDASFTAVALPVCIGVAAPNIRTGYLLLRSWRKLTIIDILFGVLLLIQALHALDYPFLRNKEEAAVFGFSFALVIIYFLSTLIPIVINRRISAEFSEILEKEVDAKTKKLAESLESLKTTQAKLINSSKFAALGEMAGGMAHELNTPLAVIKLRASQLGRLLSRPEFDMKIVSDMALAIEATTDRIAKTIQGLNSFARQSEGDPMVIEDVANLIDDTLALCSQKMQNHGINLSINIEPGLKIKCRPSQIVQVFVNILNNAHDAVENGPEKWIALSAHKQGDFIEIRIVDGGAKVPLPIAEKIFQPFFTTKPVGKGTGLGLSISKGITENHGGKIFLDRKNKNTCFVVRLPQPVDGSPR